MRSTDLALPCPLLTIRIDVPADPAAGVNLESLPARSGVFLLQDQTGGTLMLATTANLRRTVNVKLEPIDRSMGPTRRVDFRGLTRTIQATTVGSAFEADWAYLQLARRFLPQTYQSVVDRWQAWFIHGDPTAAFPQFTKTAHPGRLPSAAGVNLGPFADKHAAARYIELLQDIFDLCRYHHILVQAPNATACAYKEMGKCPAPCDGSISMATYREQFQQAIRFASTPFDQWHADTERHMHDAGAKQDFETAKRLREMLDRATPAAKPSFRHVNPLERFSFLALAKGERKNWARLILVRGGWIEPMCDLQLESPIDQMKEIVQVVKVNARLRPADLSDFAMENLGLVCWHLFRKKSPSPTCEFLPIDETLDAKGLARSLRRFSKSGGHDSETVDDETVSELTIESTGANSDANSPTA